MLRRTEDPFQSLTGRLQTIDGSLCCRDGSNPSQVGYKRESPLDSKPANCIFNPSQVGYKRLLRFVRIVLAVLVSIPHR
jgi:hypothetical protein